ncbi:hypothetical protein J1N35_045103 [Gossypium stocksii]|uniref:Uncharacterized protein n=1 Tax=Gossypium stocksii TaxID=47602 RepID=A0A9D3ZG85_9ROSI|nr:hypothetical protein J1N35_045103 [Gossypium stocksii]
MLEDKHRLSGGIEMPNINSKPTIVALEEESLQCMSRNVELVLKEFIPLKNKKENNQSEEDGALITNKREKDSNNNNFNNNKDKKNWMSSVQLWNTNVRKEEKDEIPIHGLKLVIPRIKNLKEESCSIGFRQVVAE